MGVYGESVRLNDPFFGSLKDDRQILTDRIVMRLSTPRGLYWNDPEYGLNVSDYVNEGLTADAVARIPSEVQAELEKEELIATVGVTPTISGALSNIRLKLDIRIAPVEGEDFSLFLTVDSSGVEMGAP